MKVTKIRTKQNEIPSTDIILLVEKELKAKLAKAGFITGVEALTRTSIKIGQHMRSFSLDLTKHDRNLQCSPYAQRLTNLPTWEQRVEFNNIVNSVLNKYKLSANIKSGPYIIRKGFEAMNEQDWSNQTPDYVRHNSARGYYIESVNETEYLEQRRLSRNREAAHKRNMAKQASNITQDSVPKLNLTKGA